MGGIAAAAAATSPFQTPSPPAPPRRTVIHHPYRHYQYEAPGGGESRADATARAMAALEEIALRHPGERVLVVTHSGILSLVGAKVTRSRQSENPRVSPFALPNTAINMLVYKGDGWRISLWGDVGTFPGAPLSLRGEVLRAVGAFVCGAVVATAVTWRSHLRQR